MADLEVTTSAVSMGRKQSIRPEHADGEPLMENPPSITAIKTESSKSKENISPGASKSGVGMDSNSGSGEGAGSNASKKKVNHRRIIAEDPEWNLALIESLSSIALKTIVKNFESMIKYLIQCSII